MVEHEHMGPEPFKIQKHTVAPALVRLDPHDQSFGFLLLLI